MLPIVKNSSFFFNTECIQQYNASKSEARKVKVPGHNFFKKLDDFIESCMITEEMFHIVKMSQWIPPLVQLQTSTNFQKYYYLLVAETPITSTDDGKRREVDDYHPRARLKQVHKKNEINMEDSASVQTFAKDTLLKKVL